MVGCSENGLTHSYETVRHDHAEDSLVRKVLECEHCGKIKTVSGDFLF